MTPPPQARTRTELAQRDAALAEQLDADQLRVMRDTVRDLVAQGAGAAAVKAGEWAPDFILPQADGTPFRLFDQLTEGPVVLVFFRGGWCPFCETYLRGLQRELLYIRELGAELVAVSPQLPDPSLQTSIDHELEFPVVSDAGLATTSRYGLTYQLPPQLIRVYQQLGIQLDRLNGDAGADQLPLAATFVIDRNRHIVRAEINEDYTRRYDPIDILATLVEIASKR
ncbi:MAG: peroxiredoxin-like family protein [Synoicihabitans sp.]